MEQLGYFYFLSIMNNAGKNTCVQYFGWKFKKKFFLVYALECNCWVLQ